EPPGTAVERDVIRAIGLAERRRGLVPFEVVAEAHERGPQPVRLAGARRVLLHEDRAPHAHGERRVALPREAEDLTHQQLFVQAGGALFQPGLLRYTVAGDALRERCDV